MEIKRNVYAAACLFIYLCHVWFQYGKSKSIHLAYWFFPVSVVVGAVGACINNGYLTLPNRSAMKNFIKIAIIWFPISNGLYTNKPWILLLSYTMNNLGYYINKSYIHTIHPILSVVPRFSSFFFGIVMEVKSNFSWEI